MDDFLRAASGRCQAENEIADSRADIRSRKFDMLIRADDDVLMIAENAEIKGICMTSVLRVSDNEAQ